MKRVLGLDLGTKSLGIALSRTGVIATAHDNYRFPEYQFDMALEHLDKIIVLEQIETIVLGYPLHMNGDESEMTRVVVHFKDKIEKRHPTIKVELIDERWTTKQADRILAETETPHRKRKEVIDKMAAQVILETYLKQGE